MKERKGYKFPHPRFKGWDKRGNALYEDQYLPDYVTVQWKKGRKRYEAQVHPDRVSDFIQGQENILGGIDDWKIK